MWNHRREAERQGGSARVGRSAALGASQRAVFVCPIPPEINTRSIREGEISETEDRTAQFFIGRGAAAAGLRGATTATRLSDRTALPDANYDMTKRWHFVG
jgi:hypothetical protein